MDEELKKSLAKRYKELPPILQEAISSADLPHTIQSIALKNTLHIDQAGALETEITLVLMGLENYSTFTSNLQKELGISTEIALKIATEVNEAIFKKVKSYLVGATPIEEKLDEGTPLVEVRVDSLAQANRMAYSSPVVAEQSKPSIPAVPPSVKMTNVNLLNQTEKTPTNFTEDKLRNINVSNSEKITLVAKTHNTPGIGENKPKITNPYLEPLD